MEPKKAKVPQGNEAKIWSWSNFLETFGFQEVLLATLVKN